MLQTDNDYFYIYVRADLCMKVCMYVCAKHAKLMNACMNIEKRGLVPDLKYLVPLALTTN